MWAGAALALTLILAAPVRVGFRVRATGSDVKVRALYHLGGPVRGSVRIPSMAWFLRPQQALGRGSARGAPGGAWSRRKAVLVVSALRFSLAVFRRIDRLDWATRVGTGDAATTSWLAGLLWGLKSASVSFLSRRVTWLSPPRLSVTPDFDRACFDLDLTCIFRFRIGDVIIAAISYVFGRLRKGGM